MFQQRPANRHWQLSKLAQENKGEDFVSLCYLRIPQQKSSFYKYIVANDLIRLNSLCCGSKEVAD